MTEYVKIEVHIFLTSLTWSKMSGFSEILAQVPLGSFWLGYFNMGLKYKKNSGDKKGVSSQKRGSSWDPSPVVVPCFV